MTKLDERPWFKFRPDRWLGDAALQSCSLAAQGLWINLCALMHNSNEYGYLLYKGRPATAAEIVKQLPRLSADSVSALLEELASEEVLRRREGDGCIYSKRMVEDRRAAEIGSKSASDGWEDRPKARSSEQQKDPPLGDPKGHKNKKESKIRKEKEGAQTARRIRTLTLPLPFVPRIEERRIAFNDLKMTEAEFSESLDDFIEWASTKGRRVTGEPNWNRTFASHLRRAAASWKTSFRRVTPNPIEVEAKSSRSKPSASPDWFVKLEARFTDSDEQRTWDTLWSRCIPVTDGNPIVLRAPSKAFYQAATQVNDLKRFEHVVGRPVNVLQPDPPSRHAPPSR